MKLFYFILSLLLFQQTVSGQHQKLIFPLESTANLQVVGVQVTPVLHQGKKGIQALDTSRDNSTEKKYVLIEGVDFHNGVIELEIAGLPGKYASETARGFVGLAFRVDSNQSKFECFYLRPTNGRANDQVRRNHSLQYISYPDHPWFKLREQFPEKYESYADLEPGAWTKLKIEVRNDTARLFLHGASQPSLIVNDLKAGAAARGRIGLWVGPGTEAYFRSLAITRWD